MSHAMPFSVLNILTYVMMSIVVDKSIDHGKPHYGLLNSFTSKVKPLSQDWLIAAGVYPVSVA